MRKSLSRIDMETPKPFITFPEDGTGKLGVNTEVLDILGSIKEKLVVIAIVGDYRDGKSYISNKIMKKQKGFKLGHTRQSETKGIWIWMAPHPKDKDKILVMLDTEGLSDAMKNNRKRENELFCLSILLSSHLIYNSKGKITDCKITKLSEMAEVTNYIKTNANDDEEEKGLEYDFYFPNFIWLVRDYQFEMDENVDANKYLETCLAYEKGLNRKVATYNYEREIVRNYFKKRSCFLLPMPVEFEDLKELDTMEDCKLKEGFREKLEFFLDFIYSDDKVKSIGDGHPINGKAFGILANFYVSAINENVKPCFEKASSSINDQIVNEEITKSLEMFKSEMDQFLSGELKSAKQIVEIYSMLSDKALDHFWKNIIGIPSENCVIAMKKEMEETLKRALTKEMEKSSEISSKALGEIAKNFENDIFNCAYSEEGGYDKFQMDLDGIKDSFFKLESLGDKKEETWKGFYDRMIIEGEKILKNNKIYNEEMQNQLNLESIERQEEMKVMFEKKYEVEMNSMKKTMEENYQKEKDRVSNLIEKIKKDEERHFAVWKKEQIREFNQLKSENVNMAIRLKQYENGPDQRKPNDFGDLFFSKYLPPVLELFVKAISAKE